MKERKISVTPGMFQGKRFLRTSACDALEAVPFLQETGRLRKGTSCNFFEVLEFSVENGKLQLDAEISMVQDCREIQMRAELFDLNMQQSLPIMEFDSQTCEHVGMMHYRIDVQVAEDLVQADAAIVVYADWESINGEKDSAAIVEDSLFDEISYEHVYPKKEKPYQYFHDEKALGDNSAEAEKNDDGDRKDTEKIVIALYRKPEDTKDLDYLCEFGKDPAGRPLLMVPGQGAVTFKDAEIDVDSVRALCYLRKPDGSGGAFVAAVSNAEYETENSIELNVSPHQITYTMLTPWEKSFMEAGGWTGHEFTYHMVLWYQRTDKPQVTRSLMIGVEPVDHRHHIYQVPNVVIKWGCLEKNTKILMIDGEQKRISDIRIGDLIMGDNGRPVRVMNVWRGREEVFWRLRTEMEAIESSDSHPFLTPDGWKRADQLKEGEQLVTLDPWTLENKLQTLRVVARVESTIDVYNLSLEGKSMIANGFVCGDFERQNDM